MELSYKIDYAKFAEAFNKIPIVAARELKKEMVGASKVIVTDAKLHHRFKRKGGLLEKSIREEVSKSGLSAKVFLDEGVAEYGQYVHEGTRPHRIYPKNSAALAFVKGGKQVLVPKNNFGYGKNYWIKQREKGAIVSMKGYVNHPGTKPDKFLYQAAKRQEPFFVARMTGAVNRIIEAAGLK